MKLRRGLIAAGNFVKTLSDSSGINDGGRIVKEQDAGRRSDNCASFFLALAGSSVLRNDCG